MRLLKPEKVNWSPDDQVTVIRWRRGVLIFYGCTFLTLILVWGIAQIGSGGMKGVAPTADLSLRLSSDSP
jgi:hypothetical protein